MTFYEAEIKKATNCKDSEISEIEDIMRNIVFHSTLDWQSKKQFKNGAIEAYAIYKEIEALKAIHGSEWYNHV
jgi:hypothetical protein